jgi:hypothetical protein
VDRAGGHGVGAAPSRSGATEAWGRGKAEPESGLSQSQSQSQSQSKRLSKRLSLRLSRLSRLSLDLG